jgi:chaperonin GroEL (HSP60 family)
LNVQVTAGANPVALRRGITATAKYLCEEIKKAAKPVESNKDLLYVLCQPTSAVFVSSMSWFASGLIV